MPSFPLVALVCDDAAFGRELVRLTFAAAFGVEVGVVAEQFVACCAGLRRSVWRIRQTIRRLPRVMLPGFGAMVARIGGHETGKSGGLAEAAIYHRYRTAQHVCHLLGVFEILRSVPGQDALCVIRRGTTYRGEVLRGHRGRYGKVWEGQVSNPSEPNSVVHSHLPSHNISSCVHS